MSLIDAFKDQFLEVVEIPDIDNKLVVVKYRRESGNNEIKQGSKLIVREGQTAIFVKEGQIADILKPGTYTLNTNNLPILSNLKALPFNFKSPIQSDVYFVNTKQLMDQKWGIKNPIIKRDNEFGMVRIRGFGKFSFRITNVELFMKEVFGSLGYITTFDIMEYLASIVIENFSSVISETDKSVLDYSNSYKTFSTLIMEKINEEVEKLGISFTKVIIENISLPPEVESLIDEQSGIGMASQNMQNFAQYQNIRAMRDAAKQDNSLVGMGIGLNAGANIANNFNSNSNQNSDSISKLKEWKALLDDGIISKEEFEIEKKKILNNK